MRRTWRMLPAIGIVLLLLATALLAGRRAGAREATRAASLVSGCDTSFHATTGDTEYSLNLSSGLTQPLLPMTSLAACSLRIYSYYSFNQVSVLQWDVQAVGPDPTTVALRTYTFNPSQLEWGIALNFSPPVVARTIPHVADPPRSSFALDVAVIDVQHNLETAEFTRASASALPTGLQYTMPDADRTPLPGPHPVFAVAACDGGGAAAALAVLQSVMTANIPVAILGGQFLQRFRVPAPVTLDWLELAAATTTRSGAVEQGSVQVFAGNAPPGAASVPLASAQMFYSSSFPGPSQSAWFPSTALDAPLALTPGQDYWLLVSGAPENGLYARTLTGAESADFTSAIGPMYSRGSPLESWTPDGAHALSFRLLGTPSVPVDVTPPESPLARGLRLTVSPNPARGVAFVSWSGAAGNVRFEVLDPRGRRVASGAAASGTTGSWRFAGLSDAGGSLPAGLYFVRARDGAAHVAVERLVLVR